MKLALTITVFAGDRTDGWIVGDNPVTKNLLPRVDGYDDGTGNFNSGIGNVTFEDDLDMVVKLAQLVRLVRNESN